MVSEVVVEVPFAAAVMGLHSVCPSENQGPIFSGGKSSFASAYYSFVCKELQMLVAERMGVQKLVGSQSGSLLIC